MPEEEIGDMNAIIRIRELGRSYPGDVHALRGIDLDIGAGEFVALTGPSGSGKSTLLHLMGGLDQPSAGQVFLDGQPLSTLSPRQLAEVRSRRVGFVFQLFNLLPGLTVEENVAVPALVAGIRPTFFEQRLSQLVEQVGLSSKRARYPAQLSGGEQQRVAIARALINDPVVILADEPTGSLDSEAGGQIMGLLDACHDQGRTIVLVTHDLTLANQTQRVVHLRDGRLVDDLIVDATSRPLVSLGHKARSTSPSSLSETSPGVG
jgi:putative ABC transport system ATP-binding protein